MKCISCGSHQLILVNENKFRCEYCFTITVKETQAPTPKDVTPEPKAIFPHHTVEKSILNILSGNGHGTGFVIHKNGWVLTNHHVIEDLEIVNGFIANRPHKLELEVIGDGHLMGVDLALLKIIDPPSDLTPIPFVKSNIQIGDTVYTMGNPKNLGLSLSKGTISRFDDKTLQCDLTVNPGNSGGPVLNEAGALVGVISYKHEDIEGYAFAVPIDVVKKFVYEFKDVIKETANA
jgi:serine protease Do